MKKLGLALLAIGLLIVGAQLPLRSQPFGPPIVPTTQFSIPITGTVAVATEIVALTTGQRVYVTGLLLTPVATSVVTFTTGTGANCGSNTSNLTGAMTFAAGQELNWGSGNGTIFFTPISQALCITIATAVAPGALAFAKF